jgi:hypothetical protein
MERSETSLRDGMPELVLAATEIWKRPVDAESSDFEPLLDILVVDQTIWQLGNNEDLFHRAQSVDGNAMERNTMTRKRFTLCGGTARKLVVNDSLEFLCRDRLPVRHVDSQV